jgi:uncharacterized membrane protein YhaH (DUF805 family)
MFAKMFSFKGTLNRKEYLIYGLIIPILILIVSVIITKETKVSVLEVTLLLSFYMMIVATVKRARETASSVTLVMILWIAFTPLIVLYLLFAPAQTSDNDRKNSLGRIIAIVIAVIILFGVLVALALPKLAKTRDAALQAKQEQLLKSTHQESNLTNESSFSQ